MKVKVKEVHETMKVAFTLKTFMRLVNLRIASYEPLIVGHQKFAAPLTDELKIHLPSFLAKTDSKQRKKKATAFPGNSKSLARTHMGIYELVLYSLEFQKKVSR